jgi:hypothetical protein
MEKIVNKNKNENFQNLIRIIKLIKKILNNFKYEKNKIFIK